MITAETAVALPAIVLLLGGLLTVIVALTAQLQCVAGAREGARAAARGEDAGTIERLARQAAPEGARVTVGGDDQTVSVTVVATVQPLGLDLAQISVSGTATAQREPERATEVVADAYAPAADAASASGGGSLIGVLLGAGPGFRGRRRKQDSERGSATIYLAAAAGVMTAVIGAAAVIGQAHIAHRQAESAADLAALAGAQALVGGEADPCAAAASIARRNEAVLVGCAVDGETVIVDTTIAVRILVVGVVDAHGRARAGPVPDGDQQPAAASG